MSKDSIKEKCYIDFALLGIGWGWLMFSYLISTFKNDPLIFSRAGSIVVLFAVIVEYRHMSLRQRAYKESGWDFSGSVGQYNWSKGFKRLGLLSHITAVFGTLVWGYGDILIKCLYEA